MKYHRFYRAVLSLIFLLNTIPFFGATFFSGQAGAGAILTLQDTTFSPDIQLQGFFAGQAEFTPNLLLRMKFSGFTENILSTRISDYSPANFYIDGITLSYHHTVWDGFHNYISLFFNEDDPIGSDSFLRRYFGIMPISSHITQSLQGAEPLKIYSMGGLGLSYTVRFPQPMALAAYAYVSSPSGGIGLNADLRFAGKWDTFLMDFALGINADGSNRDSNGNSVLLLIKTITLRSALTMLIGREYSTNVFLQAGIYRGLVYPASSAKITLNDIFLLFEPRLRLAHSWLNISFFIFPDDLTSRLFYTSDPVGINVAYIQDSLFAQNISGGLNFTITSKNPLDAAISTDAIDFAVTPFMTIKTRGGDVNLAFRINPLRYKEISRMLMFTVGYKTQL